MILGTIGLLVATLVFAQAPDFAQAVAKVRQLEVEQGPKTALPEFERLLKLARESSDQLGEAIVIGLMGNSYRKLTDYPRAIELLNQSLAMKEKLGNRLEAARTLNQLGLLYWNKGDYTQAIQQFTRAITLAREIKDRQLEANVLNNLGLVYDELGDYRRSRENYDTALEVHRALGNAVSETATLSNIGGVYYLLGQFRDSMRYYQQALAISERLKLKSTASADLGNLALCHLGLGQMNEALEAFDRALVLAREAGIKKEEADWHKGKGSALVRLGRYDQATEEYRLALATYEQAGLKREWVEGLNDRGNLHVLLGDLASGERDFRQAVELARGIGHPRGITANLLALGDIEWRRKRFDEAGALYRQGLTRAQEAGDRTYMTAAWLQLAAVGREQKQFDEALGHGRQALAMARTEQARFAEAQAHYTLGEIERARGRSAEALDSFSAGIAKAEDDPEIGWRLAYGQGQTLEAVNRKPEAVDAYRRAVVIIESVRSQLRQERFRAGYIEDKHQVYVDLVRLLLELKRIPEAFQFAERLRAQSYQDLIRGGPWVAGGEKEAELRQRVRQLQRAIEQENNKLPKDRRAQAATLFSAELAAAERAYQNLLDDLRSRAPESAAARALNVPSTSDVQKRLPPGTAIIEYVIADESLSIFLLTSDQLRATTVAVRAADLRSRVELLRDLLLRPTSEEWRRPAESLSRALLAPVEQAGWLKDVQRLYVVPHGILHYLPFAVLSHRIGRGPRFLMEDYQLAYLPAAAVLVHGSGQPKAGQELLAMAPARARLLFSQQEARRISEYYPRQPNVLLGSQATESVFKNVAGGYQVIHLATHGFFNKLNPLFSGVELEADQKEDGRLEVHEILGLRLNAQLVTLSACNTALGSGYFTEVPAGDDFVGLTRAFLFAGSPSVLASLWEVNDRSTLELMRGFYSHLQKSGKAEALALAQRSILRAGGRFSHPYFWAPFVLVGEMR